MLRAYASLSPEAHLIIWTSAFDTRPLVEFRNRIRMEYDSMRESIVWISIYKPSPYISSTIDILVNLKQEPLRYLVAYPMKKDPEWYLIPFEERRSIMAEHIGIARSHKYSKATRSYTTYAFGIASYEFLVVYEVVSLYEWIEVVERLREAKARKWVAMEEPVLIGEFISGW
jgi:chlorite dismutase